ncbi:P-loop ATPase, Sll1717 family [Spartinivicinus poritis]|uniref:Orc1-like AAA ATPase domain-containing protein n=1 Tax=Spartinivicinus poritis TaxID=2994640 RepID=A0ABT5UCI3_9GAMM|nr:hypothetical protein [Spartinivicinus sp. A2-2]MDE1463905.1 hypothetical protein [Spartinivicinus sp. A2-2]
MLSDKQKELVSIYITEDEAFGPVNAAEIEDTEALQILFDTHNRIYKQLHQRPSIVIGRKGAGKTSYLHSAYFEKNYDYVVEISTPKAFTNVIESIEKTTKGALFPETIAEMWETVLCITFFSKIREELCASKKLIDAYLAKIGIRAGATIDDVLWNIADTISEKASGKALGIIAEILRRTDNISFADVKETVRKELQEKKQRAVIMLDSLDEFQLDIDSVSLALQGLLKCIGRSNKPSARTDIRFCLPAELFHKFQSISSNPNKDFRRELVLHWTAPELLLVAANRLLLYLELYKNDFYKNYGATSILNNNDVRKIFHTILPNQMVGGLGVTEEPLAYIIRHTQLLPRHLLILLNSIWQRNKRLSESNCLKLHEDSIREGVSAVEQKLVMEIFVAYKAVHPHAQAACEQCFPELHHVFSIGDLERVFRTHGKRATESDDFFLFKRMLIEIGAIGKVINVTDRYVQALFEYTVPHRLVTSTDDELCIHPLFSEIYSAKTKLKMPVYPYGSMLDDPDYREWD